ncbi:MAG: portal protein [Planctomycetota bacterium]
MPQHIQHDRLLRKFEELKADRVNTENTWQQIADHLLGRRDFTVERTRGQQRMQTIYDDTSKISGGLLAGAIHSLLTSPAAKWFAFRFEDDRFNDIPEAMRWLDLAEKHTYATLARPETNFHAQLAEMYVDLIYFGTGALFVEDVVGGGVRFSTRPLQELFCAEDPSGRIDTVIRRFKLSARQAVELFGTNAVRANAALQQGRAEDTNEYLHFILRNDDFVPDSFGSTGKPWASFHLSLEDHDILAEGGFHEMPIAIPRWESDPGEVYGRGPGWNALSNQKMLNEMKRVSLKAGQKAVDPPVMVDSEGVLPGDLRLQPGGVIPINAVMSMMNPPIQPLPFGGDFNINAVMIEDTRKAIQDAFHHQLIEVIRDPRMTATQVLELSAQMQRHLAPILGRMQTQLLEPTLERVFAIESRAGRLPPAPPELSDVPIRIDYVSPVARAQRSADARAVIDFQGIVANLSQVDPGVLDVVDFDAGTRELAQSFGVPPSMIRDPEDVEARRQAARELAAEEAANAQTAQAATVAKDLSNVIPINREAQAG